MCYDGCKEINFQKIKIIQLCLNEKIYFIHNYVFVHLKISCNFDKNRNSHNILFIVETMNQQ